MLGSMISKIRKEQHISKVELSRRTGINIGHITHIEKGERHPSHKTLKNIANALNVPYQNLSHLYDKTISEEDLRCEMINHLSYNKVLAIDSYSQFIECPHGISTASVAIKIQDDSMEPNFKKNSYAFLTLNVPLSNKEVGLFKFKDTILIRKFIIRKDKLVLRAENKLYPDIDLSENDEFTIIGKVQN